MLGKGPATELGPPVALSGVCGSVLAALRFELGDSSAPPVSVYLLMAALLRATPLVCLSVL
jgi:hypothetical protein